MTAMIAGRYEPLTVTVGGMGEVIECKDTHLQRKVIVKRLQAGVETRRLVDEQKALAKLRSKHVIQLYDIVELNDRKTPEPAIVVEYIEGKDLQVESCRPNHEYLKILWQVACGLSDTHAANVIHRDIKPGNIRIDNEGVVKILDFGLARSGDDAKTRSIIGTPLFMAPELWGHSTISFDKQIDVYAFGVLCLALVTRAVPNELMMQPPAPIPRAFVDRELHGVAPDLIALFHHCLSNNPKDRPSMRAIRDALAAHLLQGRHRALVVMEGNTYLLDDKNRKITLNAGLVGSMSIEYDSFNFRVTAASGAVTINNIAASAGYVVPGCSVITFGNTPGARRFVTFDVSNPEVHA